MYALIQDSAYDEVTTVTPMKRGLKVMVTHVIISNVAVTTVTPMKRGLKERIPKAEHVCQRWLQPLPR